MDTLIQAFVFFLLRDSKTGCRLQDKDDEAFNDEAVQEEEDDEEKHRCA